METSAPLLGEPLPVELMNTAWADRDGVHDALRDPGGVRAWLHAVSARTGFTAPDGPDCPDGPVDLTDDELGRFGDRLVGLRDALRRLAAEVTADPRPAAASRTRELEAAVTALNRAAGESPHWSVLSWTPGQEPSRHTRSHGEAGSAAVSALAEESIAFFAQDARNRLRACLAPGCVLYFVKNHPRREWCSAGCGNRARSARHYQRHRPGTA
ncbi:CGNR zinc finger domain-containing protein [Streptomyces apricus]|uniref:Zinc finger CGNR domain-containing protein n=1 Tax=Streptomyces apricus TaxID=1828112 RepID=A0A5B0BIZ1_9ACTN|nr:ABATE domain-containing protein [Streptomyces apricus]KAA0940959.1 hypothetical protein FGF04_07265 [Streptomyces apricus]